MSESPIIVQVEKNATLVGQSAAEIVLNEVNKSLLDNKQLVLILPTGSTSISLYDSLVKLFYEGKVNFSKTVFFNLDEYVGLGKEDQNSYFSFMNSHFYSLIKPGITKEKLAYFGFKPLAKKDCFNKRNRHIMNESLNLFCSEVISNSDNNPMTLEAFENTFQKFKKNNRGFLKLYSEYMDDKTLPSFESLKGWIEKDISLRSLAACEKNIHLLDGLSGDIEEEVKRYQRQLNEYLRMPNRNVVCIGGIGQNPAHIAFNEFVTESFFQDPEISDEVKNKAALNSQTRIVPLAEGTRAANARFFDDKISKVPHHAMTLGFKEILSADRILILACGSNKKKPLYDTFSKEPSYLVPASLLQKHSQNKLQFILDEAAYGLSEKNSLFSLSSQGKLPNTARNLQFLSNNSSKLAFWNIPNNKQPTLLDKGFHLSHKNVKFAITPKNQKVLWAKVGKIHYSLWQELKENHNKIQITQKLDPESLLTQIEKHEPDIIILPYVSEVIENFKYLKKEVSKRFSDKPILGIFYETSAPLSNVFLPITKEEQKNKVQAVSKFHHSQVLRTKFDVIAEEMSSISTPLSQYNEGFSFFNLESEKQKLKLSPFEGKFYITGSSFKNKKIEKATNFSFSSNDQVIIISPHPDDAEISMGALIQHLGKENITTHVLNATSGHRAVIQKEAVLSHLYLPDDILEQAKAEVSNVITSSALKSRIRECESLGALSFLNKNISVHQLRLPFYDHARGKFGVEDRRKVDDALYRYVEKGKKTFFFLPYPQDSQHTHRKIYRLFMHRISNYYRKNPNAQIVIAFYPTPWTGHWNMYDYSYNQGSKLAAISGGELLLGSGKAGAKPETLGGILAKRYEIFYFN